MSCRSGHPQPESRTGTPTLREDPVHVEAVGGAGLVEERVAHVDAQLPGALVVDHARVAAADFIWRQTQILSGIGPAISEELYTDS